jgi:hypothetical protein
LSSLPCCPRSLRGTNLVKEFAKFAGLYSNTIEIKNIVVGDLPYDGSYGDFYVSIGVGTNPDMVTALQEEMKPKVVHFPEILQLKIRNNFLEPRVTIRVQELNIVGSEQLCELNLSSRALIDYMDDKDPYKRFSMRSLKSEMERETPAWIAMEISRPTENRDLERWMDGAEGATVRTYTFTGPRDTSVPAYSDGSHVGERSLNTWKLAQMKDKYTLLDDAGNPIEEPLESTLDGIACRRKCVRWSFQCCLAFVVLVLLGYGAFRFYIWSCYRQFKFMTMAVLNKRPMPISDANLKTLVTQCHDAIRGTGASPGTACRPDSRQILQVCERTPENNRPEAFAHLIYDMFAIKLPWYPPCFHGICAFRDNLVQWDRVCIIACISLVIALICCKLCGDASVSSYRKRMQKQAATQLMDAKTRAGTRA